MIDTENPAERLRLGDWCVRPAEGTMERAGEISHLEPQQMDLLVTLAASGGRVVSKRELLDAVWKDVVVEEAALAKKISQLRRALGDDARSPRYIRTIHKRGYQLIASLDRLPEKRFGTRPEATGDVAPTPVQRTAGVPPARPGRARRRGVAKLLAVALVVAALWFVSRRTPPLGTTHDRPPPRAESGLLAQDPSARDHGAGAVAPSIAVLRFRNLDPDPRTDWRSAALTDLVSAEIGRSPGLRLIPGEAMDRRARDLSGSPVDLESPAELQELVRSFGARWVVFGSVEPRASDRIALDVQIRDPESGAIVAAVAEVGERGEMLDLASLVGMRLRARLGDDKATGRTGERSTSWNPAARRLYYSGREHLRRFEARSARELLSRAIDLEPTFPLGHLALSEALTTLGLHGQAVAAAQRAADLAEDLPREQQLWIAAGLATARGAGKEVVELYMSLHLFAPDNLEYALALAQAQSRAEQPEKALETLGAARGRSPSVALDPRHALARSAALGLLGRHREAVAEATLCLRRAGDQEARLLAARARQRLAESLLELGETESAMSSFVAAEAEFAALGDRRSADTTRRLRAGLLIETGDFGGARALLDCVLDGSRRDEDTAGISEANLVLGRLHLATGEIEAARGAYRRAREGFAALGRRDGQALAANRLAILEAQQDDLDRAEVLFSAALQHYRALGDRKEIAKVLANLGKLLLHDARPTAALRELLEADRLLRDLDLPVLRARVRFDLGDLHLRRGDLRQAKLALQKAAAEYRRGPNPRMLAKSLVALGEVLLAQGDFVGALASFEESLALRIEVGHVISISESHQRLAALFQETGSLEHAERHAREALARSSSPQSLRQLAEVLREQGRLDRAAAVIEEARRLVTPAPAADERHLTLTLSAALIDAAAGRRAAAFRQLEGLGRKALELGLWNLEARTELELARLEASRGERRAASSRLTVLEISARDNSWIALADKARNLRLEMTPVAVSEAPRSE